MKTTTAERDPRALAKLRELIEDIEVAMVVTVAPEGSLRSRPLVTEEISEDGELWFITSEESEAAGDLAEERAVNASYADPALDRYVSVTGQASLLRDPQRLQQLWDPALTRFFPQGLDDPHLALLRVRIETAEYWDATTGKMAPVRSEEQSRTGHHDEPQKKRAAKEADGTEPPETGEHTKIDIRATPASG